MPIYTKPTTLQVDSDLVAATIVEGDAASANPGCLALVVDVEGTDLGDRVIWLEVRSGGARVPNPALSAPRQTMASTLRAFVDARKANALTKAGFTTT